MGLALVASVWLVVCSELLANQLAPPLVVLLVVVPVFGIAALGARVGARWGIRAQRLADQLESSDEKLRAVFFGAGTGAALISPTGKLLEVNPALCTFLGLTEAQLLATDFQSLTHPEDIGREVELTRRVIAGEIDGFDIEKRFMRPDNSTVWGRLTATAVRDASGAMRYGVGMVQDITGAKAVEAQLHQLAAAVEQATDTIVICDLEGRVQYVNPAFERVLGFTGDELRAMSVAATGVVFGILPDDASLLDEVREGRVWTGVVTDHRKDGGKVDFAVTVAPVRSPDGVVIGSVGVGRDLSLQRTLEAQLRQAQTMEAIGQLAGGIAHDFNNLLTIIRGFTELHLAAHAETDPSRADVVEIERAAERAADLVRQLLAFSRRSAVSPTAIDVGTIVGEMLPLVRRLVGEDVVIVAVGGANLPSVLADRRQLEQALLNLVSNARDAMPDGGQIAIETAAVRLDEEFVAVHPGARVGHYVMLAMSDTGVGMDAGTLSHLFEPFFTTKERGKGTGLGLASVYGTVKQAHGFVYAESALGRGSIFRIYLPAKDVVPDLRVVQAERPRPGGGETILVVEDEDPLREFICRTLQRAGYRVVDFGNPIRALEFARSSVTQVDALLSDVVMPELSGPALTAEIQLLRPDLPILLMTGYADRLADASARPLAKPFDGPSLLTAVRQVLDQRAG